MALVATSVVQSAYTAAAAVAGGSGLQVDDLSTLMAVTETHIIPLTSGAVAPTAATLARFTFPYACVITGADFGIAVAGTAAGPNQFDIKVAGVSIYTTTPTIDNSEFTTSTATTPSVLGAANLQVVAANTEIQISCVAAATSSVGANAILRLRRTS